MKNTIFLLLFAAVCAWPALGAENGDAASSPKHLAVLKPNCDSSLTPELCKWFWQTLEAEVNEYAAQERKPDALEFRVVTRANLSSMLQEITFDGTHLVRQDGEVLNAESIQGVSYLLASSLVKTGDANSDGPWMLQMNLFDGSTGVLDRNHRVLWSLKTLAAETLPQELKACVRQLFSPHRSPDAVLLLPSMSDAEEEEKEIVKGCEERMRDTLTKGGISLAAVTGEGSIENALSAMGKESLDDLLAGDWPRLGALLGVGVKYIFRPKYTFGGVWRQADIESTYQPPAAGTPDGPRYFPSFDFSCQVEIIEVDSGRELFITEAQPFFKEKGRGIRAKEVIETLEARPGHMETLAERSAEDVLNWWREHEKAVEK